MSDRKIAIVGTAVTTLHQAPYEDPTWEIWGLNALHSFFPQGIRWDRWFELHPLANLAKRKDSASHLAWLRAQQPGKPIYTKDVVPEFPASVPFPREIVAEFPQYFTNTVSYMLAMAIKERPATIGVWGVDMSAEGEYGHQRHSCEFFLGIAVGTGIEVQKPIASDLLAADHLYALEEPSPYRLKLLALEARARQAMEDAEARMEQARNEMQTWSGALQGYRHLLCNR